MTGLVRVGRLESFQRGSSGLGVLKKGIVGRLQIRKLCVFLTTIFGELVGFGVQLVIAAFGLNLGQFKLLSKSVNFELKKNKFVCHEDVLRVDVPYSSSR